MRHLMFSLAALTVLAVAPRAARADTYTVDPAHTTIGFAVKHMVISSVKGHFKEFSGTVTIDDSDPTKTSVSGSIKVASVDTGNEKRDNHLRGEEFFNAEKYPEINFKSKKVEKRKDGYVMTGNITIRGITKEIEVPFEISGKITDPMGNERLGIEASTTLNRQDFGISWSKALEGGGLIVGNEVKIELNIEAVRPPEK